MRMFVEVEGEKRNQLETSNWGRVNIGLFKIAPVDSIEIASAASYVEQCVDMGAWRLSRYWSTLLGSEV